MNDRKLKRKQTRRN